MSYFGTKNVWNLLENRQPCLIFVVNTDRVFEKKESCRVRFDLDPCNYKISDNKHLYKWCDKLENLIQRTFTSVSLSRPFV